MIWIPFAIWYPRICRSLLISLIFKMQPCIYRPVGKGKWPQQAQPNARLSAYSPRPWRAFNQPQKLRQTDEFHHARERSRFVPEEVHKASKVWRCRVVFGLGPGMRAGAAQIQLFSWFHFPGSAFKTPWSDSYNGYKAKQRLCPFLKYTPFASDHQASVAD